MIEVVPYETRLRGNFDWALQEGSMYFEHAGGVQKTLRVIAKKLDELGVPYAVCGGMALFAHGYRRFTEDVDILVTKDGLKTIQESLTGLGYIPLFSGSKNLRDTETGVKIEFLITGGFPGDGLPKPVAFPDPAIVGEEIGGIKFLSLTTLVELKLASGITNPLRAKDIVDVQALISELNLTEAFAERIHPFVRDKFLEIVRLIRDNPQPPE